MASAPKTIHYRYDAAEQRVGMTDPDGGRFTYAYDPLGQITWLENPQGQRTSYVYDANNRRTLKALANGTMASLSYDDAGQVRILENRKSDASAISRYSYTYDAAGNRTSVRQADGSRVTWSYDNANQLTREQHSGTPQTWSSLTVDDWDQLSVDDWATLEVGDSYDNRFAYDLAGNRTLKNEGGVRTTYAYDAASQLTFSETASGRTTYTFDADGNQQLVLQPSGERTTTLWDYENKTSLIMLPGGARNTMAYEPDGLRIRLDDSTGTKKFLWDDQNYLSEYTLLNALAARYTAEPQMYGNVISQYRNGTNSYYHYDALGSTRQLTNSAQNIIDTYEYDAWGELIAQTGVTVNPFRYVGELGYYFDPDTGTYYIRARIYEPAIARWWSVDPLEILPYYMAYAYASNQTTQSTDPSGMNPDGPSNKCDYCGPDATGLLITELGHATAHFQRHIRKYLDGSLSYYVYYRTYARWRFMQRIGNTLDWQNIFSDPCLKPFGSCPTRRCERTYEICGRCVHDHFIGNLMFGYWLKLHDFQNVTMFASGNFVNWIQHGRKDESWDIAGYVLGVRAQKWAEKQGFPFNSANFCAALSRQNDEWYEMANETGIDYSHCLKCPCGIADSGELWIHRDPADKTQFYPSF